MPSDLRLLFVLPDLAYITKLIPGKKEHNFSLSDFRQINGSFLDDNLLIEKNLEKLFSKMEAGSYKLVLPDFLFTNTIINLEVKSEEEVKHYFNETLLPSLGINKEDFHIDTTILSNYKGMFKVQLTALEKSVVAPLVSVLSEKKDIKIESISPLSWTSKSIISLEPSVSILQLGGNLYLAQHYIGVEQNYFTSLDEAENFVETVKTLKGTEPSLQTVYLLSNSLIDDKLKVKLKETLPVQQLADLASENEQMPSYVKQIVEAAAKTFSITEYLLPKFEPDLEYKASTKDNMAAKAKDKAKTTTKTSKKDETEELDLVNNLVKPVVVGASAVEDTPITSVDLPEPKEISAKNLNEVAAKEEVKVEEKKEEKVEEKKEDVVEEVKPKVEEKKDDVIEEVKPKVEEKPKDVDLAQFANLAIDPSVAGKKTKKEESKDEDKSKDMSEKKVIKNKTEAGSMTKMIFIGFLSFVVTIALGVGIGLSYLKFTSKEELKEPVTQVEVTPEPTATETPEPLPEITKADYKLMVVNATKKAGLAGLTATDLETSGFEDVDAQNALGIYEEGNYLLVAEENAENEALLNEVELATSLEFTLEVGMEKEDSSEEYAAIVVLSE